MTTYWDPTASNHKFTTRVVGDYPILETHSATGLVQNLYHEIGIFISQSLPDLKLERGVQGADISNKNITTNVTFQYSISLFMSKLPYICLLSNSMLKERKVYLDQSKDLELSPPSFET